MEVNVSFAEVSRYVHDHYGTNLEFSRVSDREVCVAYLQRVLIKTIRIPINVTVDKVEAAKVEITYKGSLGIDTIIGALLSFMKSKLPALTAAIAVHDGHRLTVDLTKLTQTEAVMKQVAMRDIRFYENGIQLEVKLK